ncbi:MAG TPA: hypothetical protein VG847_17345 [Chitinophagaceae bacterium]|nr:hypothetical protein [Chitinophagaceae bacterium]
MKITYLPHANIDKQKWDGCIDMATNGLVYAYSFYLDAMSRHWDALVMNDYEMVMPLTWNKKYGFRYLYPPFYCAQLGIFGNNITGPMVNAFLCHIPPKFKYWDIYLNKNNLFALPAFPMVEKSNYVLLLNTTYEVLQKKYAESHRRNISRAIKAGNTFRRDVPVADVISLAAAQAKNFSPIAQKDFDNFSKLFALLHSKQMARCYGVFDQNNQLTASCAFVFSHHRAYYILVGNHPNGRTSGASHLLIDQFIQENAGKNLLLDFEGGNINGIGFFYKSFGASPEKFAWLKMNRLPAVARLFRK